MTLDCVNDGGLSTVLETDVILQYEKAVGLSERTSTALQWWQARPGDILTVIDPQGDCWRVRLETSHTGDHHFIPFEKMSYSVESPVAITLCQALPEKERFELILQKATELGVSRIVPMITARSTTRELRDAGQRKSHRWPDVLLKAAKQCRRAMVPELTSVADWQLALEATNGQEIRLLLYEGTTGWCLDEVLNTQQPASIAIYVGPEGGFTPEEVAEARAEGVIPVSLGARILRTETAAIAAVTAAQYAVGDLSSGKK